MRSPTQCVLWKRPELINDGDFFDGLDVFGVEEHWVRELRRCRECGQLYVRDFFEEIDFTGGEDDQVADYVPVDTQEEIDMLKDAHRLEILTSYPRLTHYLRAGDVRWITKP